MQRQAGIRARAKTINWRMVGESSTTRMRLSLT
jgi:hypothetical protein